ncbi:IS4 family transposase [Candidatus Fukatsuia endosymbiont of Tuberolachnus salignus]|uniref:IS4 family transposase n=1 Tax=Candidatus Fukatsuia endosymbiont of Tuberolachnus salignus TaxID=3077957 RepID=UPI00313C3AB9
MDFDTHKKTEGLGSISKAYHKHKMGLMLHAILMVTQEGLPLGLSSLKCWSRVSREEPPQEKQRRLYQSTMKEKESIKWIETLYETAALIPKDTCLITLGDREADIFELFRVASSLKTFFIIRNRKDRKFIDEKGKKTTVQTALSKTPILKTIALTLPKNQQRVARTAYVDIRSISGWLPIRNNLVYGPTNKDASRHIHEKVHVSAISVKEQPPPEGVAPVEWVLLTNLTATDAFEAEEKVNGYRLRWKIEEFFKTLKSGCCVEQCRLNTATKLTKMITLKSIIAFKLMHMTKMAALCPEATCTDVLSKIEWQTLYCRIQTTSRLPEHPPTVLQAITWLGQLGGFLNRRAEDLPGIMSLWRGYEILQENVRLFIILNNKNCG